MLRKPPDRAGQLDRQPCGCEGLDLPTLQAVQIEAARSVADIARHAVWENAETTRVHRMEIEVRDENGPVLQTKFTFESEKHQQQGQAAGAGRVTLCPAASGLPDCNGSSTARLNWPQSQGS